jgi:hypothetical protein
MTRRPRWRLYAVLAFVAMVLGATFILLSYSTSPGLPTSAAHIGAAALFALSGAFVVVGILSGRSAR